MSTPLMGTASAALAIDRVSYTHDGMIDLLLANPEISQNKLAQIFGYSVPWISRVMNSDAFTARFAQRKEELVDPVLKFSIEEKFKALADTSLDIIQEKLLLTRSTDMAFKALEASSKALGYGARADRGVNIQQNFVVPMPAQMADAEEWSARYRERHGAGETLVIQSNPG